MIQTITKAQLIFLRKRFAKMIGTPAVPYTTLTPKLIPESPGVYVITANIRRKEHPYYVGRTKNLRRRIYNNHLMGPFTNARLKKHLVDSEECADIDDAKRFLRAHCFVRWIEQIGFKERGAVEGYVTGLLFPKYGIYEEH
jgi:hypothetical protein